MRFIWKDSLSKYDKKSNLESNENYFKITEEDLSKIDRKKIKTGWEYKTNEKIEALSAFIKTSNRTIDTLNRIRFTIKAIGTTLLIAFMTIIVTVDFSTLWQNLVFSSGIISITVFLWLFFDRKTFSNERMYKLMQSYKIFNIELLSPADISIMDLSYFKKNHLHNVENNELYYIPSNITNYKHISWDYLYWVLIIFIELIVGILVGVL